MEAESCFVCSASTVSYNRNPFKIHSKYTQTRICTFLDAFLDQTPSKRTEWTDRCVCATCLDKINDYDLACQTAERIENELRELLQRDTIVLVKVESVKIEECVDDGDADDSKDFKLAELQIDQVSMDRQHGVHYSDDEDNDEEEEEVMRQQDGESTANENSEFRCRRCKLHFESFAERNQHRVKQCPYYKRSGWTCSVCKEVFSNKAFFEKHMRDHKREENRFKCKTCAFDLDDQQALDEHMLLHGKVSDSERQCVLCAKQFTKKGALVRHMRTHSDKKYFQCDRCGKEFVHKSSMEMHIKAHDDIREKKCSFCDQKFRSSSHLSRHMRIHTGAKPFACPICDQKFAQRYNMTVHQRLHTESSSTATKTPEKTHTCTFCGMGFVRRAKLEQHLQKSHEAL